LEGHWHASSQRLVKSVTRGDRATRDELLENPLPACLRLQINGAAMPLDLSKHQCVSD